MLDIYAELKQMVALVKAGLLHVYKYLTAELG